MFPCIHYSQGGIICITSLVGRMFLFRISTFVFVAMHIHCEIYSSSRHRWQNTTLHTIGHRQYLFEQNPKYNLLDPMVGQLSGYYHKSRERRFSSKAPEVTAVSPSKFVLHACPCAIQYCFSDTIVNCVGMSLKGASSTWFPRNTTVILLDNNDMKTINNESFIYLTELRVLSLSNNKIKRIEQNAFRGLENLQTLNLYHNRLSEAELYTGLFDPLVRLTDLRLWYNRGKSHFPESVFKQLKNLNSLTIYTKGDTIFSLEHKFSKLNKLVLSGDFKIIGNTSFENVPQITQLFMIELPSLSDFSDTALQSLHNLDYLYLRDTYIGVTNSLRILKPLVGRTMKAIAFNQVYIGSHESYSSLFNNEGILDFEKSKYLLQICVENFSLVDSYIFVIRENAFRSRVWEKCLKNLDLSRNPIIGTKLTIAVFMLYKHMEMLNVEIAIGARYIKKSFPNNENTIDSTWSNVKKELQICNVDSITLCSQASNSYKSADIDQVCHNQNKVLEKVSLDSNSVKERSPNVGSERPTQCSLNMLARDEQFPGYFRVHLSYSLKYVKASRLISSGSLNFNILFVGNSNLIYLDLRENGLSGFRGSLLGLDALQTLMLSGNDVSALSETFFDGMCHLVELDLANCHMDANFMSNQSTRVFHHLRELQRLDLSYNSLYSLKSGTFVTNSDIEQLDLSQNRFRNIPFDLKNTPKLQFLDMRDNSITLLEPHETHELDKLANQPEGLSLLLSGNILSCGCDSLRFLSWLGTTHVRLDDGRNFTCMNKEGHLSYWTSSDDPEALWRKCWGGLFLSFAVILFFSISIGFLSVFFVWKNKTFIESKILQMLTGYKLKGPEDYKYGVYLGYASDDYTFPCNVLRKLIEDELKLKAYVPHRDMDASGYVSIRVVDAINVSWRIILVFSQNFLFNDEWSTFTTNTAIHALSPANPARVVVLVHESLQHSLPTEVLSAVHEDNILVVSTWQMNSDLREKIRTRLMKP